MVTRAWAREGIHPKNLTIGCSGIAVTMVIPDPYRGRLHVVHDHQSAMQAVGQTGMDAGSLEEYFNTRVLTEGLVRAGRDVSRAKLPAALTDAHNFDLGGFSVNYAQAPFVGSKFVNLGVFNANGRFSG